MSQEKGFKIELSSDYTEWWRYNATLMCGCFDAAEVRIDFLSVEDHIAPVGANLAENPAPKAPKRNLTLNTNACHHLMLYTYIVPNTLPIAKSIAKSDPFNVELKISYNDKELSCRTIAINQWSGTSLESRVEAANYIGSNDIPKQS